jgi:short-subunit dehydrogenase
MPGPNLAVYAASKAYVLAFSEALSQEVKGGKVTVTALCPGGTATAMVRDADPGCGLSGLLMMDARSVAREGFKACMDGKSVHVAGTVNRLAVQWVRYRPRWLARGLFARKRGSSSASAKRNPQ